MFNLSYLSTAKAGHVIVYEHELEDAMAAFRGGQDFVGGAGRNS
jgi:cellobiose dehydrogenase (acceptor)